MKLSPNQVLGTSALIGALVVNTHGAEFFIAAIGVDLADHSIIVELEDADSGSVAGVNWNDISDWTISLNPPLRPGARR